MMQISDLVTLIDAFKAAEDIPADTTASYRIFKDSKKLAALRDGAEISVGRFNDAVKWLSENWPEASQRPQLLTWMLEHPNGLRAGSPALDGGADAIDPMKEAS